MTETMEQLNKRLARGETEAFVEVYDLLGNRLLKYLTARLNATDAQDVLQEVFARLVRHHKRLAKAPNLTAYVFLTARNEANRFAGKRKTGVRSITQYLSPRDSGELVIKTESVEARLEQTEFVDAMLGELAEADREIVQLKIYSGLTFSELAEILEMPLATVATKYRRAIAKMQSRLDTDTQKKIQNQESSQ